MQFESEAVHFQASSIARKSTLDDQTVVEEDHADEGSETESGPEEFVVALHDFTSSNETCLSFESGQVIKVFNRDESGWWDGELNGQRGWFPSNYVDEEGITSNADGQSNGDYSSPRGSMEEPESSHQHITTHSRSMKAPHSTTAHSSSSSSSQQTYTRGTSVSSRTPTPTSHTAPLHPAHQERSNNTVLDPIYHATSLLHNAVRANRVAHFQPSTACVISSVRSVLSATDCLTRESSVLKSHPILAKERKQILAELSKLVTQARVASAPTVEAFKREWEMDEMLNVADSVLKNVRRFLEVAIECGVAVPNRRSSIYDDMYDEKKFAPPRSTLHPSSQDRRELDKTPTPESPRTSTYRGAYSSVAYPASDIKSPQQKDAFIDLRAPNGMDRQPSPVVAVAVDRHRSDSLQSDAHESSSCDHSQAGSGSGSGSGSGFGSGTSQSASCDSLVEAEAASSVEVKSAGVSLHSSQALAPILCSPANVLARVQQANDQLLSIIAAFIGHIHGHTRNSHASSYAFLIDMTRATVDGVRNLLVVVEAVHDNAKLRSDFAQAMSILWETRESVYDATAALVTAARIITSSSIASASSAPVFATEEEEKVKLLQTATAVLRTGGECVGAVKLCLNRADPGMKISISDHSQQQYPSARAKEQQQRDIEREQEQERLTEEHLDQAQQELGPSGLRRGKHTLSLLGRKATSLSCLREQYEVDFDEEDGPAAATRFDPIEEDEEEVLQGTVRMKRGSVPGESISQQRWGQANEMATIGDTSDSSEPMSRDHSQTSEYTLHSDSTAETSARPSMDRSLGSIDDRLPHSAPILGSFPRYDASEGSAAGVSPIPRNRSTSLAASSSSSPARSNPPAEYVDSDVCFNSEGQLTGATLPVLVEKMTPHDTTVEASFSTTFFLCFRLFTTPLELFAALESRYHMQAPHHIQMDADEFTRWTEVQVAPVRLRIFNFFKMWLETHWNAATDYDVLEPLITFCRTSMTHSLNKPGQRLAELARKRQMAGRAPRQAMQAHSAAVAATSPTTRAPGSLQRMMSTDRLKLSVGASLDVNGMYSFTTSKGGNSTAPAPIVSKGLLATLKSSNKANVVDVDPLELARQLTIMESKIYCSILPEELLGQEFSKKAGISNAVHIKTMSSLSTYITGWISECILNEEDARKRTQLVKYFIKLGDRCLGLNNFNTLMAIQCALNSSTISRLKKTWDGLPAKYRQMMDYQRQSTEHTRNFAGYRQTLRQTVAPALPFVGLFLTDLTFCHEGNAPTRPSPGDPMKKLLNFDKYVKMSRIIGDLQRFQVPYNLQEVPEIQAYLQAALNEVSSGRGAGSADDLYRRSLLLEPRSNNNSSHNDSGHFTGPAVVSNRGLGSDGKLGLDIFNWK